MRSVHPRSKIPANSSASHPVPRIVAERLVERARADAERIRERLVHEVGPAEYYRALRIAMEETTFPVDIIEIEKVDKETRDRITRRGRLVYEERE
ncbi:MAG: hypothetical protein EA382_08265 [Spirochaetaceae bacterium]|nr:MAG: hypothetical protein EA382_08265 [Spirochaetaceae bacterium]